MTAATAHQHRQQREQLVTAAPWCDVEQKSWGDGQPQAWQMLLAAQQPQGCCQAQARRVLLLAQPQGCRDRQQAIATELRNPWGSACTQHC